MSVPHRRRPRCAERAGALVFEADKQLLLEVVEPPADGWVKVRHRDGALGCARAAHLWGV
ncbi:MAG: hypothetical protein IPL06_15415 [Betaproteobacteria bacterium]|nr:hypothetical protein [Betaproteobacteria bacterium]